jgi:hypothetical protein
VHHIKLIGVSTLFALGTVIALTERTRAALARRTRIEHTPLAVSEI